MPHRKHITSPLQRPPGQRCLGKQLLFIVRITRNTQMHFVGTRQGFNISKQVVHIVTTGL
jgi:hypothetical protein